MVVSLKPWKQIGAIWRTGSERCSVDSVHGRSVGAEQRLDEAV